MKKNGEKTANRSVRSHRICFACVIAICVYVCAALMGIAVAVCVVDWNRERHTNLLF